MPIYKRTTELTKCADWLTAAAGHDIQYVYFGDKEIFSVWATYDGTLPAQYSANGDYLADYRIYGADDGVGEPTDNSFDENSEKVSGFVNDQGIITQGGNPIWTYDYFPIIGGTEYTYISYDIQSLVFHTIRVAWYDANKTFILRTLAVNTADVARTVTAPSTAAYARLSIDTTVHDVVFNSGSTVPASYVPYGYEVDMSVSDGTTSTTTPIYIGSSPLEEDEYVDYGEQKVYRKFPNIFEISSITNVKRMNTETDNGFSNTDNVITFTLTVGGNGAYSYNSELTFEPNVEYQLDFDVYLTGTSESNKIAIALTNTAVTALMSNEYFNYEVSKDSWVHVNVSLIPTESAGMLRIQARYIGDYIQLKNVVLRKSGFQPTDPPVPLPALPTVDGTTITDYAGQSAAVPSKFVAKYRKEGY